MILSIYKEEVDNLYMKSIVKSPSGIPSELLCAAVLVLTAPIMETLGRR